MVKKVITNVKKENNLENNTFILDPNVVVSEENRTNYDLDSVLGNKGSSKKSSSPTPDPYKSKDLDKNSKPDEGRLV